MRKNPQIDYGMEHTYKYAEEIDNNQDIFEGIIEDLMKVSDSGCGGIDMNENMSFLDMLYSDIENIMKRYGFSQISEQHDNGSVVLHFYNRKRDILFIIEEQENPDKELLEEDYGIEMR